MHSPPGNITVGCNASHCLIRWERPRSHLSTSDQDFQYQLHIQRQVSERGPAAHGAGRCAQDPVGGLGRVTHGRCVQGTGDLGGASPWLQPHRDHHRRRRPSKWIQRRHRDQGSRRCVFHLHGGGTPCSVSPWILTRLRRVFGSTARLSHVLRTSRVRVHAFPSLVATRLHAALPLALALAGGCLAARPRPPTPAGAKRQRCLCHGEKEIFFLFVFPEQGAAR